jgi:glycosyltransferase involved in cell wall biosynthesis
MRWRGTLSERVKIVMDDHMLFSVLKRTVLHRAMYATFYGLFGTVITPWFVRQGTVFVGVTAETKDFMVQKYQIPEDKISIIPIGVDIERFRFDAKARVRVRERLGYGGEDVVIIHAGKLIAEKGPHLIVKAAIPVMKRHERARLLFIGAANPDYVAGIKRNIAAEGLAQQVTWLPAVPHDSLADYYSAADIGIWPSQESMTTLEVSSCGRPIIVGASKVSRERIKGGGGLSAATEDELRRHIELLVTDESLRKRMGDSGRVHMCQEFDWRVIASAFLDLIRNR